MIMKLARALLLPPGAAMWWLWSFLIKGIVAALGLLVVPLTYRYRYTPIKEVPGLLRPWLNPEDWYGGTQNYAGSVPQWWIDREGDTFWKFYKYHAIRNPADGLRNYEWLNLQINPDRIQYKTDKFRKYYEPWYTAEGDTIPRKQWYLCWAGIWAGFKWQWIREKTYTEFKVGFRIEPNDAVEGPDPKGSRAKHGASFASKLILNREHNG